MFLRINDPHDLELIDPEECKEYPEFYYYPDNHKILVNKIGNVINLKTGKYLKSQLHKPSGRLVIVFSNIGAKAINLKLHRIIARTFIGRPSRHLDKTFNKLEVNHIDGIKTNNELTNLEWCIGKENIQHAHNTGLHSKDKKVLAKQIYTNEITVFNSTKQCADYFGIHRGTMWKNLNSSTGQQYCRSKHVFKLDNDVPWINYPIHHLRDLGVTSGGANIDIMVIDTVSNSTIIFESITKASKHTKISYNRITKALAKANEFKAGDFIFKKLH